MSVSSQQLEWKNAQKLSFSLDLVAAARSQLEFLALVDSNPQLFEGPVLERAIERYEYCWLPLASAGTQILPPLDCAWIWHCHRLNPVQYADDCKRFFGKIIQAPLLERTENVYQASMNVWRAEFPGEPYNLDLYGDMRRRYAQKSRNIAYNLVEAALRQRNFYYQVSEPHYLEEGFLLAAATRYKGFLHLINKCSTHTSKFFVPTYDIDLMWHAHQLSPSSYQEDVGRILGRVLDHDDADSSRKAGGRLDTGFADTELLWENAYGIPYSKAGCMYRGEPPAPISHQVFQKLASLSKYSKEWITSQRVHLTSRHVFKAHLSVRSAKDLSSIRKSSSLVALRMLRNFQALKLDTGLDSSSSTPHWNHVFTFTCATSTEGVVFELVAQRRHRISKFLLGSKALGELTIPWTKVINSELQSLSGWFQLENTKKGPLFLEIFMSITPPVLGPYLLRSVRGMATGDDLATFDSPSKGLWLTRTVYDHANDEVYIIRTRYKRAGSWTLKELTEADKVVHVHQGGWIYNGSSSSGRVAGKILGSARQVVDPVASLSVSRTWLLLDGSVTLTIRKDAADPDWNLRPLFEVQMSTDCPIRLYPGRKLQFAVANSSLRQEAGFVTMVRFCKEAPQGVATALFNWKSGGMQINHDENVLLVLLFSATIGMSISDMLGKKINHKNIKRSNLKKSDDYWGEVQSDREQERVKERVEVGVELATWWIEAGINQEQSANSGDASAACGGGGCGGGCGGGGGGCSGGGGGGGGGGCGSGGD